MARHKLTPRRVITKPNPAKHHHSITKETLITPDFPPVQIFTSSTGTRGEVLRLGATVLSESPDLHTHLVVLPGNPGVIEYYRPFLRRVFQRLPVDVRMRLTVHGLGLPGHDLKQLNGLKQFGIGDHLDYCHQYLQSELVQPPVEKSSIVIMGHSYGSFLSMKLIQRMALAPRVGFIMLMPALYRMSQCAGAPLRWFARDLLGSTTWGTWLLTALVSPVIRDTIVWGMEHGEGVEDVTKRIVDGRRRALYLNICYLAREEIKSILDPVEDHGGLCQGMSERSLLLYASDDRWCDEEGIESVCNAFGDDLKVEWAGEGVKHAFVLSGEETEKVAKIAGAWLCEWVRDGKGKD